MLMLTTAKKCLIKYIFWDLFELKTLFFIDFYFLTNNQICFNHASLNCATPLMLTTANKLIKLIVWEFF